MPQHYLAAVVGALALTTATTQAVADRQQKDCLAPPSQGRVPADLLARCGGARPQAGLVTGLLGPGAAKRGVRVPTDLGWGWESLSGALVNFALNAPGTLAPWGNYTGNFLGGLDFDASNSFTALYAIEDGNPGLFSRFDTATGFQTPIGSANAFGSEAFSGLAADPTSGVMYASSCSTATSSLYTIDVATGAATRIGAITNSPCTIGIAVQPGTGQMYGYDIVNDSLMSIDKATGAGTVIGPLGFDANFGQGLDFDDSDGTLYLFAFNNANLAGELRTADLATGATTLVGTFPNPGTGEQLAAAGIAASSGPPTPSIITAGSTITAEGCNPGNGSIDPGEVVTVGFAFRNVGQLDTVDLVATLQATGGVTPLTTSQDYGVLTSGGPAVTRPFQLAAAGPCGGTLTASFDLVDGASSLGTKTFTFTLGSAIVMGPTTFLNPATITINDAAPATPYPSDIAVAGLPGSISKVTVTLNDISHTFPADIEVILVNPAGDVASLMANAGGGGPGVTDVTITLDDAAGAAIPVPLAPGTFLPTAPAILVPFPPPAPGGPYQSALSALNGSDPNGTWSLYVLDDAGADIGEMEGWSIAITTSIPECCAAPTSTRDELIHDSRESRGLETVSRLWRISQKARSSYEVAIDAVTGDIGTAGPDLRRLASDGTTVLQTGVSTTGGTSKHLRFANAAGAANDDELIQVASAGCSSDCDVNDTVRVRAYDTTYRISRFNNSATQITVLVIANPTDQAASGTLWFYAAASGSLLASQAVAVPAHGTFVLNTSGLGPLQGQAGSATFSNDAAFGALTGKAVAVEPATGFTFDTAMVPRTATTKMVPRDN